MEVLVVRHAIAMDRDKAKTRGLADGDRPLTDKGRSRMKQAARGLCERAPELSELFTSPLRRAVETAEILSKVYEEGYAELERVQTAALLPDADPTELTALLARRDAGSTVAVVGHEPQLGCLLAFWLTGVARSFVELQKGGVALLHFDRVPGPSAGRLIWLLPPAVLRSLG